MSLKNLNTNTYSDIITKVRKGVEEVKIQKLDNIAFSKSAMEVLNNPDRYVPVTILKDVIRMGHKIPDPQGTNAMMYYSKVSINGKDYNLEVLYDGATNQIWHFEYGRDAIGNLPKI